MAAPAKGAGDRSFESLRFLNEPTPTIGGRFATDHHR